MNNKLLSLRMLFVFMLAPLITETDYALGRKFLCLKKTISVPLNAFIV